MKTKKYVLAKDLPDHPAGTELIFFDNYWATPDCDRKVLMEFKKNDLQRAIETGWVREVKEMVVLYRNSLRDYRDVRKTSDEQFTEEECDLMQKALNGELVEVDLQKFADWWVNHPTYDTDTPHAELLEAFNRREK